MKNREFWWQTTGSAVLISCGLALAGTALSGCGGGSEKSTTGSTSPGSNDRKSGGPVVNVRGNELLASNDRDVPHGVWTDKDGNKFFHKIPYDVFFQDPLTVGNDRTPIGGGTPGTKLKSEGGKKNPANGGGVATKKPATGDWATLASGAILDAETKRIRNFITQKMQTVGRYNGGYKEIQYNAAALAAIANIIAKHPDKVTWKADALYVRDLGTKMSETAVGLSKKNYDMTKIPFENFVDILNRNKPDGLKEPDKEASFFDVAERAGVMKRMQAAFNWMKTDVTAEDKFKAEAEQVTHEATILGVLAKVIGDQSYDSADEPEYKAHVNGTVKATQDIVKAVKASDFTSFRSALDRIGNRCNQCHTDFKNN